MVRGLMAPHQSLDQPPPSLPSAGREREAAAAGISQQDSTDSRRAVTTGEELEKFS